MKTYVATYIEVLPKHAKQAIPLIEEYRTLSIDEEGFSGIDILKEVHRHNRFVVLEEWNDDSSFQSHQSEQTTAEFRSRLSNIHKCPYDQRVHHDFAVGQRSGADTTASLFVITHVDVPPPRKDETEVLLAKVAEEIRNNDGNLRFDVFQQNAPRTNHFTTIAVWKDESAFTLHEANVQTRLFREALGPMLGAPYDERIYQRIPTV
jgi:quinol monooxygenase YgiN